MSYLIDIVVAVQLLFIGALPSHADDVTKDWNSLNKKVVELYQAGK